MMLRRWLAETATLEGEVQPENTRNLWHQRFIQSSCTSM